MAFHMRDHASSLLFSREEPLFLFRFKPFSSWKVRRTVSEGKEHFQEEKPQRWNSPLSRCFYGGWLVLAKTWPNNIFSSHHLHKVTPSWLRSSSYLYWVSLVWPVFSFFVTAKVQPSELEQPILFHHCSRNLWATYGEHMGSRYDPHMFPICSTYGENFKNNQIIMWPICCLTYGETYGLSYNIWGTYGEMWSFLHSNQLFRTYGEHKGNIWETYGEHMGNIWGTYGKHMGSTPKATPNKTSPFPCSCSTLKDSQASTKFALKVRLLSTKMVEWILDRRLELMKSWLDSKLQSMPSASTWCCKREVAGSSFLLPVLCNDKTKTMYEELQSKTNSK